MWKKQTNNRNRPIQVRCFVLSLKMQTENIQRHPTAKHYTCCDNTVLRAYTHMDVLHRRCSESPSEMEQSRPACCRAAVWLLAASRHSGFRRFRCPMSVCASFFSRVPRKAQDPRWQEEPFDLAVSAALPGFFPLLQLPVAATCGVTTISASQL